MSEPAHPGAVETAGSAPAARGSPYADDVGLQGEHDRDLRDVETAGQTHLQPEAPRCADYGGQAIQLQVIQQGCTIFFVRGVQHQTLRSRGRDDLGEEGWCDAVGPVDVRVGEADDTNRRIGGRERLNESSQTVSILVPAPREGELDEIDAAGREGSSPLEEPITGCRGFAQSHAEGTTRVDGGTDGTKDLGVGGSSGPGRGVLDIQDVGAAGESGIDFDPVDKADE